MKKVLYLIVSFLILITFLTGCSSSTKPYTYRHDGTSYTINPVEQTITHGEHTYVYTFNGNVSRCDIEIVYPDNSRYYVTKNGNVSYGGNSEDYNSEKYADGSILCDAILQNAPKEQGRTNPFIIILIIAVGIFGIASPKTVWQLEYGWRFKNAEPSDLALTLNRIGGAVLIVIAIIFIFI